MQLVERNTIHMANPIKIKKIHRGSNTEEFLSKLNTNFDEEQIKVIADESLQKFKDNTPSNSGLTKESWYYEIDKKDNKWIINFNNSNIQNGMNIAMIIEHGHATPTGKWISGKPYITNIFKEIQTKIIDKKWREITKV